MELKVFVVLVVAVVFTIMLLGRARRKDGEWQDHQAVLFGVTMPDASTARHPVMRRWNGKRWEYREMTEAEYQHFENSEIW